jgi:hypothetical protein
VWIKCLKTLNKTSVVDFTYPPSKSEISPFQQTQRNKLPAATSRKKIFRSPLYQAFHTPSAIDNQYALKVDYQRYYPTFAELLPPLAVMPSNFNRCPQKSPGIYFA